jgi:hypothetical protein
MLGKTGKRGKPLEHLSSTAPSKQYRGDGWGWGGSKLFFVEGKMKNTYKIALTILCFLFFLTAGHNVANTCPPALPSGEHEGWELTVQIKGAYATGDFKILTKEGSTTMGANRAILIIALSKYGVILTIKRPDPTNAVTWMTEDGKRVLDSVSNSSLYTTFFHQTSCSAIAAEEDIVLVLAYKEKEKETDVFHSIKNLHSSNRLTGRDKFLHSFNFTYNDLINAVKKLIKQDKLKLAGDTISVKNRVFKQIPNSAFVMGRRFAPPAECIY